MNYDDDQGERDTEIAPAPEKVPATDPYQFIDRKGKLTNKGKIALHNFRSSRLVPDDDVLLEPDEIREAFEASPEGFSLDDLKDEETFDEILCKHGTNVLRPGANPESQDSWYTRLIEKVTRNGFLAGYRARFVDELGIEAFDPTADDGHTVDYLVDALLPTEGVHMFVSQPGALKTWLAYHVAIAVSRGEPVLNRFAAKKTRTVIIDFEMGPRQVRRRLRLLGGDGRVASVSFPPLRLDKEKFWTELHKRRPGFVVVDSLSGGSGVEYGELDSRFAEPLGRAMRFAVEHGCTFLFLHHSPKAASLSDAESLFRGTGAIRGKVDSAYYFRKLPTGPKGEERAEVVPVKTRNGQKPPKFAIQVTDERGVELFEGKDETKPAPELTIKERILAHIAADPDATGNSITEDLELRRETVFEAIDELKVQGRIRVEGKGKAIRYVVVAGESFPHSCPANVSDTNAGSD